MKCELPVNHGLSERVLDALMYTEGGVPSLTDVQYASLEAGLGTGSSVLVVSPTSTGKTQIAIWAIANGIETSANAVYLVTHRALAKQKFEDFQNLLSAEYFKEDTSKIVLATGDNVIDGQGESPADPLRAQLLVATYEKYLAMLSASGVPASMANTVVVCDEIQLLGDKSRGQNVEVLLTLLRNAGWKQFVGLSAVLDPKDAEELSSWLDVILVSVITREKDLQYEYWSAAGIDKVVSSKPGEITHISPLIGQNPDVLKVIRYLEEDEQPPFPVIVFCMRKQDIYDLATADMEYKIAKLGPQQSIDLGDIPDTISTSFLSKSLAYRIAIHSTDLTDVEREIVEDGLINGKIDVVYATSTLAAGVNFPLGAAIFCQWQRYDFAERTRIPIGPAEFHNMAGRVGRLGAVHERGRVIFFSETGPFADAYKRYLELDTLSPIVCRIGSSAFDQLSLQLVASGLCHSRDDVIKLICSSFSGNREKERRFSKFQSWPSFVNDAINSLITNCMLAEMRGGRLVVTPVGKSVAHSGFKVKSAAILIEYFAEKGSVLAELLRYPIDDDKINRFAYLIFSASFSTPEFYASGGSQPSRFLPWPLQDQIYDASPYADDLLEPNWFLNFISINSAQLALDWINGAKLIELEKVHSALRAGMLLDMYRNLGWALQGMSSIISAASDSRIPDSLRPLKLRGQKDLLTSLRKLPRAITRLNLRVSSGLPDDTLWMNGLNQTGEAYRLSREDILGLRDNGITKPEQLMLGTPEADEIRREVFAKATPAPMVKANWLRDRSRTWKVSERARAAERHRDRARRCREVNLVDEFYSNRGKKFESVFEKILLHLEIPFTRLDNPGVVGAPDYLIELKNSPKLIVELKSREGDKLIDYNGATEVLSAAEIHGYRDTFCVTLCHPGVDPSVPMAIAGCGRLSVIEANDLGEGLLRLCQGRLSQEQIWEWLATPGQALSSDLPYTEHSRKFE